MAGRDRHAAALSRRQLLALGAGAAVAVACASVGLLRPYPRAGTARAQLGSFDFRPDGLAQIRVHWALGAGDGSDAAVVIVLHGDGRNAEDYRDEWAQLIAGRSVVAVVPQFSETDFPGSRAYNQGGVVDEDSRLRPADQWAFAYLEPLFATIGDRLGAQPATFDLFGHSAGAQFVHRFVELCPTPRLGRAVAANAGWYTVIDPGIDYPYGVGGAPRDRFDLPAAFGADLTIMLGDQDVGDHNLRHDELTDAQGLTRWERGQRFFAGARQYAARLGVPFAWQLHPVPGVGHDYRDMSASAAELLGWG
jgi:hypothetical protein